MLGDGVGGLIKVAIQGAVLGRVQKDGYQERRPRADSGLGGRGGFNFRLPPLGGGSDSSGGGWIGGGGGSWGGGGDSGGSSGGDGFTTGGSI